MADITVTAANVAPGSDAFINKDYNFGATVTQGQSVYLDTSTTPPTWKLADADSTATTAAAKGMSLNAGSSGQPAAVQISGGYNPGGTVAVGTIYVVSGTAGGICPSSDLASGDWVTIVGIGTTTSNIQLLFLASGVQVPA